MKKFLFLLIAISFIFAGCASMTEEDTTIQSIVDLPGMSKIEIYNKSSRWMAEKFVSYSSQEGRGEIIYKNLQEGRLVGSIQFTTNVFLFIYKIRTSIDISIKDSKARLIFVPRGVITCGTKGCSPEGSYIDSIIFNITKGNAEYWTEDYKTYMTSVLKKRDNNW